MSERIPPPRPSRATLAIILGVGLLVFVVSVVGLLFFVAGGGNDEIEGTIDSTGMPHGGYHYDPTSCSSGEHENFFGVWVGTLKIVKTPDGAWETYVKSPPGCRGSDCKMLKLDRAHCSRYSVNVQNTPNRHNRIRVRKGSADLECKFPEGGSLTAHLKFDGCK